MNQTAEVLNERERYIAVESWEAGYRHGVDVIADVLDDHRYAVFPLPRYTREERIQQRLKLFERCAEEFHAQHGTKPWAGVAP